MYNQFTCTFYIFCYVGTITYNHFNDNTDTINLPQARSLLPFNFVIKMIKLTSPPSWHKWKMWVGENICTCVDGYYHSFFQASSVLSECLHIALCTNIFEEKKRHQMKSYTCVAVQIQKQRKSSQDFLEIVHKKVIYQFACVYLFYVTSPIFVWSMRQLLEPKTITSIYQSTK